LEVRLVLLYGGIVTINNELTELRQSLGTTAYQIGEELKVRSFLTIVLSCITFLLQDNIQKYSQLVLLSPSIYHYKGKVPREYLIVSEQPSLHNCASDISLRKLF